MQTQCPHCDTRFVIGAAHLRAAHGQVKCGRCTRVFDAIPHLIDELSDAPAAGTPEDGAAPLPLNPSEPGAFDHPRPVAVDEPGAPGDGPEPTATAEPRGADLPPVGADEPGGATGDRPGPVATAEPDSLAEAPAPARTAEPGAPDEGPLVEGPLVDDTGAPREGPPQAEPDKTPGGAPVQGLYLLTADRPAASPFGGTVAGLPQVLREDLGRIDEPPRRGRRGALLFAGALLALIALVLQYAWFQPLDLVKRYPQALAAVERWCAATGCVLTDRREPERIRVITRDVRVHPRYEGALQVAATLVNTAPYPQPYPRVRFSVFNVNGQTIASRTFEPREYLARPPRQGAELAPRTPLQIALEMLAPEEAAVSFEFQFL